MQLDKAGIATTLPEILEKLGSHPWCAEILEMHPDEVRDATVWHYPEGIAVDEAIETGRGPYVVLVEGDLSTRSNIILSTHEYIQGHVLVTGDLRAASLIFKDGARIKVDGSVLLDRACVGTDGDRNAVLSVGGELHAPEIFLGPNTSAYAARGIRGLIYAETGFWENLEPDIPNLGEGEDKRFVVEDVLNRYGDLDFAKLQAAILDGRQVYRSELAAAFPLRFNLRPT